MKRDKDLTAIRIRVLAKLESFSTKEERQAWILSLSDRAIDDAIFALIDGNEIGRLAFFARTFAFGRDRACESCGRSTVRVEAK